MLLAIASTAGVPFVVAVAGTTDEVMSVGAVAVVVFTVIPLAVGIAIALAVATRVRRVVRVLQTLAVVVAVGSVPLPLAAAIDTATGVVLAVMHLVVGAAYIAAIQPANQLAGRRSRQGQLVDRLDGTTSE